MKDCSYKCFQERLQSLFIHSLHSHASLCDLMIIWRSLNHFCVRRAFSRISAIVQPLSIDRWWNMPVSLSNSGCKGNYWKRIQTSSSSRPHHPINVGFGLWEGRAALHSPRMYIFPLLSAQTSWRETWTRFGQAPLSGSFFFPSPAAVLGFCSFKSLFNLASRSDTYCTSWDVSSASKHVGFVRGSDNSVGKTTRHSCTVLKHEVNLK